MSVRRSWARRFAVVMFVLNVFAVTWPVITLFRGARPSILGFPLSMAWPVGWIVIGWVTLLVLDHFESHEDPD